MANILVRNIPQNVIDALKRRAKANRRSLQQEVLSILETADRNIGAMSASETAAAIRARLAQAERSFSESIESVREDRER